MTASLVTPVRGLLAAKAALRAGPEVGPALEAIVESVADTLGYAVAALNLYRPATHDFEVVIVHGPDSARRTLLHTSSDAESWDALLGSGLDREDCYFVPEGALEWDDGIATWTPDLAATDDPGAWHAEDMLFVVLRGIEGAVLGILSLDSPRSGRRPTDADLETLGTVAFQAGLVLEASEAAEREALNRAAVQALLTVGKEVLTATSAEEIGATVCAAIRDALRFERVVFCLHEGDEIRAVAQAGRDGESVGPWRTTDFEDLYTLTDPGHGCALLTLEQARQTIPDRVFGEYPSVNNGRGPHGWDRHWLVVPLVGDDGSVFGFVWPDDPRDRRVPTVERLRELRAFANQAAAAIEMRRTADRLRHLSRHDPLTGLRNRRGLHAEVDALLGGGDTPSSVVVLDADAFKRVNDELGHPAGDAALRTIADALKACLPPGGVCARLGGEEFALVTRDGGEVAARTAAEAVRRLVAADTLVPWGLRLSAGIATQRSGESVETLVRNASRALQAAKRLGRDRVVAYDGATIEPLLDALDDSDTQDGNQLATVMLLAETLDLRDEGTARHSRTVARYAEALARRMALRSDHVERVRVAGLLHDVGKLAIPDKILHKPGKLDATEWDEIRAHPETGARIVSSAGLRDVAEWVLAHHERWDGGGYPFRIAGAAIPVEARILAVADAYEAMTAVRPYRLQPLTAEDARAELRRCAGTQFDPDVVDAFLALF